MGKNIVEKVISDHLAEGEMEPGTEIGLDIDQVLLQDTTGTMVWLQYEAMGGGPIRPLAANYCDHNTFQFSNLNTEDHAYIRTAARKFGAHWGKPGSGVCHQVHREHFAAPGQTMLGADSHTPTTGGIGMFAVGTGGQDVALSLKGAPYIVEMPKVVNIHLTGELTGWASAKDAVLTLLDRLSVRWGVGRVMEYSGPGVKTLNTPERCTLTNMATELGCTTGIFPSDEETKKWLEWLGRGDDWQPLEADDDAEYDERIELDLSEVEPMIAEPSMPDNVVPVSEISGRNVDQVVVGSCTNASYFDLRTFAEVHSGYDVDRDTETLLVPASRSAMLNLAEDDLSDDLMEAGVSISESTCGPCIGVGHVPAEESVSVRTINRNFNGRSGIKGDKVHLSSVETAAACSVAGEIRHPAEVFGETKPEINLKSSFTFSDGDVHPPADDPSEVELEKGSNIKPLPDFDAVPDQFSQKVAIKLGDDISTDHISPAGAHTLRYRSNIEEMAKFTFMNTDEDFYDRITEWGGGCIVGAKNYGQGSSREHAAICPRYLGVRAVLAKNYARIHRQNLNNFGILPLTFTDNSDWDKLEQGDELEFSGVHDALETGGTVTVTNKTQGYDFEAKVAASERERNYLRHGGRLPYTAHLEEKGEL